MRSFRYARFSDPVSAVRASATAGISAPGAESESTMFLAGGTNLLDLMKLGVQTPHALLDITGLPFADIVEKPDGSIHIGALVRNSALAAHPLVQKRFPVLSEALLSGASPQLRNMATVGGNLLQRTRCAYFNDLAFACNKRKPGSGCPAIQGYNRNLAILGTSASCIATNPSDMNVALAAIEPIIRIMSQKDRKGEFTLPFSRFHRLPGSTPQIETALKPGELIIGIELPKMPYAARSRYLKVRDRSSYEFALVSVAAILDLDGDRIRNARIALGGVGTRPWRSPEAEAALLGAKVDEQAFSVAAKAAVASAKTYTQNAFKVALAQRAIVRALIETAGVNA